MNLKKNEKVFNFDDVDHKVYILNKGKIRLFIRAGNKECPLYILDEPNTIFGIVENVLDVKRLIAAQTIDDDNIITPIEIWGRKLFDTVTVNPKLGLQLAIFQAVALQKTNAQLTNLSKTLNEIKNKTNELCINYYEACEAINELNNKYKYPWLKAIYEQARQSLIYQYGNSAKAGKDVLDEMAPEAQQKIAASVEKENLENTTSKVYKAGEVLCNEGELGKEMYILLDGELSVYVNNNKVAEITKKGEVIGEIAVLLGIKTKTFEKRTATVKVKKDAKIVSIPAAKIIEVISKDPKIIVHTLKTLSERIPESYNKLTEIYDKMDKAINLMNPRAATSATCPKAYQQLIALIEQKSNDREKVDSILKNLQKWIDLSKESYSKFSAVYE
ncbi:MAG TPA: cyclic nucleotide-binding domain-containing protein, partial [bacterium]|nr:cyclic nucleotide-binding domain-containing protein [bacterium]